MGVKGLPSAAARAKVIDELGELERQRAAFKPKNERALELQKEIAGWYEHLPGEQEFEAQGDRYIVQVGPRALTRTISSMAKVFAFLGKLKFLEVCEIPMKVINREIPEEQHADFLEESRDGKRKITVIAKAAARKAA
jgi:hypothetical protein